MELTSEPTPGSNRPPELLVQAAPTETLAFAAPGLVHRFGNAVFTIQGHAQLLDGDGPHTQKRDTILAAADRCAATLLVMRSLIGPVGDPPQDALSLLTALAEILRVPVREAGHVLELVAPTKPVERLVDGGLFCSAVIETVRQFVAALPGGHSGTFELHLANAGRTTLGLAVTFRAKAGSLPFPLPVAELCAQLGRTALPAGERLRIREQAAGIAVTFPCTADCRVWHSAEA